MIQILEEQNPGGKAVNEKDLREERVRLFKEEQKGSACGRERWEAERLWEGSPRSF